MKLNETRYHTIEIIDDLIKYAYIETQAYSSKILNLVEKKLNNSHEKTTIRELKKIFSSNQEKKSSFILLLSRKHSTVKYIEIPSSDPKEIEEIIRFQAVKQVPFSLEEIIVDFEILKTLPSGYSTVMLVIIHKDVIKQQLKLLAQASIYPDYIKLTTQAISYAFDSIIDHREKPEREAAVALVDIDYKMVNFLVTENGILTYSRSIPFDALDEQKLSLEIERSLGDCRLQNISPVKIIINGGDDGFAQELKNIFIEKLEIPCDLVAGEKSSSSLLSLKGAALSGERGMNFLPSPIRKLKLKRKKIKEYSSYLFFGGIIILLIFFSFLGKMAQKKRYLLYLNNHLSKVRPKAKKIEEMQKKVRIIERELSVRGSSLDILKEVYSLFPQKVSLAALSFEKDESLILKGVADNMSKVFDLIPRLEKSPYLENVVSKYATKREIKGKELIEFQLQCSITANPSLS
ncbi:pilus assembly protein PilM [Candidatus Auribacterota bacterium]